MAIKNDFVITNIIIKIIILQLETLPSKLQPLSNVHQHFPCSSYFFIRSLDVRFIKVKKEHHIRKLSRYTRQNTMILKQKFNFLSNKKMISRKKAFGRKEMWKLCWIIQLCKNWLQYLITLVKAWGSSFQGIKIMRKVLTL